MTKRDYATLLGLAPHVEGGFCRRIYQSGERLSDGTRAASAIHYAVGPDRPVIWHRISSTELWFHQGGDPVTVILGGTGEDPQAGATMVLGPDPGQHLTMIEIPPHTWQRQELAGREMALCSCVVVPAFSFDGWEALTEEGQRLGPEDAY